MSDDLGFSLSLSRFVFFKAAAFFLWPSLHFGHIAWSWPWQIWMSMSLCSIDDISHELKDQSSIDLICASLLIVLFFEVVSVSTSPAGDGDGHGSEWLKDFIDWLDHWYAKLEIPPDYEKWLRSTLQADSEISLWNLSFDVSARVGWRPMAKISIQAKAEQLFQACGFLLFPRVKLFSLPSCGLPLSHFAPLLCSCCLASLPVQAVLSDAFPYAELRTFFL